MTLFCRVEMLGGLLVRMEERRITRFRTQKTAALLAYLAYHLGRPHPREVLTEMLWPEDTPSAGRRSLTTALSSLRRQLEPPGTAVGTILVADRFAVGLNEETVTTDVREFEEALEAAETAASTSERMRCLSTAVDLYRGPLLPGRYEEWVLAEQDRLAESYFAAVEALAAALEEAGDLERAAEVAHRIVAIDPLREEGYRILMRLLALGGRAEAALRHCAELERVLREELGAGPSPATRDLRETIAAGRVGPTPAEPRRRIRARRPRPVRELPTGTVTLLLTEVENAVGVRQEAPGAFAPALAQHNRVLREELARCGGHEVSEAEGSLVFAFARASDAVPCAVAAQQRLATHRWPRKLGRLRVRMALDTGEVELHNGRYRGAVVDRATGLLLAAHGGQILCSQACAELLKGALPAKVRLVDLGSYRLHKVEAPERLFCVEHPGVETTTFPPPRAAFAFRSNLPPRLTRFFGREEERARVQETLLAEPTRMVTLTGPGGSGKTRLATEVADDLVEPFRGAVWLVSLQELKDARLIPSAVANALGVVALPQMELLDQSIEVLTRQPSVVLFDNFEHLAEGGAPVLREFLARVPELKCLVTSRHCLNLNGEAEFFVGPLPTPAGRETPEALLQLPSVQLFVDRAQAVRPDFQVTEANAGAIAELCARLEGIPLALELAAARIQILSPAAMLAQLKDRFSLLVSHKRDIPDRHRSLRATLDWSYELLPRSLQRFLAKLSVFRGGWTTEAAEAVCQEPQALAHLERLVGCSLVLAEEDPAGTGQPRFRMLETLREYGQDRLSPKVRRAVRRRHAHYYHHLVGSTKREQRDEGIIAWGRRLDVECDNLRAALDWLHTASGGCEEELDLAAGLQGYWAMRGDFAEAHRRLTQALGRRGARNSPHLARACCLLSDIESILGNEPQARALAERGLRIARAAGDGIATARALYSLAGRTPDLSREQLLQESMALYEESGFRSGVFRCLRGLARLARGEGDLPKARRFYRMALREVDRQDDLARARLLSELGELAAEEGHYARARDLLTENLPILRRLGGSDDIATALHSLSAVCLRLGDLPSAHAMLAESLETIRQLGATRGSARRLGSIGLTARARGDHQEARDAWQHAAAVWRQVGDTDFLSARLHQLGDVHFRLGEFAAARAALQECIPMARELDRTDRLASALNCLGLVEASEGNLTKARAHLLESNQIGRRLKDLAYTARSLRAFAVFHGLAGDPERAARLLGATEALRIRLYGGLRYPDEREHKRLVQLARGAFGERAFAAARAKGRKMTVDEALDCALEEPTPKPARRPTRPRK